MFNCLITITFLWDLVIQIFLNEETKEYMLHNLLQIKKLLSIGIGTGSQAITLRNGIWK